MVGYSVALQFLAPLRDDSSDQRTEDQLYTLVRTLFQDPTSELSRYEDPVLGKICASSFVLPRDEKDEKNSSESVLVLCLNKGRALHMLLCAIYFADRQQMPTIPTMVKPVANSYESGSLGLNLATVTSTEFAEHARSKPLELDKPRAILLAATSSTLTLSKSTDCDGDRDGGRTAKAVTDEFLAYVRRPT